MNEDVNNTASVLPAILDIESVEKRSAKAVEVVNIMQRKDHGSWHSTFKTKLLLKLVGVPEICI